MVEQLKPSSDCHPTPVTVNVLCTVIVSPPESQDWFDKRSMKISFVHTDNIYCLASLRGSPLMLIVAKISFFSLILITLQKRSFCQNAIKMMHQFFSLLTIRDRFGLACFYVCDPRIDFEKKYHLPVPPLPLDFFLLFHCNVFLKPARPMRVLFLLPPPQKERYGRAYGAHNSTILT